MNDIYSLPGNLCLSFGLSVHKVHLIKHMHVLLRDEFLKMIICLPGSSLGHQSIYDASQSLFETATESSLHHIREETEDEEHTHSEHKDRDTDDELSNNNTNDVDMEYDDGEVLIRSRLAVGDKTSFEEQDSQEYSTADDSKHQSSTSSEADVDKDTSEQHIIEVIEVVHEEDSEQESTTQDDGEEEYTEDTNTEDEATEEDITEEDDTEEEEENCTRYTLASSAQGDLTGITEDSEASEDENGEHIDQNCTCYTIADSVHVDLTGETEESDAEVDSEIEENSVDRSHNRKSSIDEEEGGEVFSVDITNASELGRDISDSIKDQHADSTSISNSATHKDTGSISRTEHLSMDDISLPQDDSAYISEDTKKQQRKRKSLRRKTIELAGASTPGSNPRTPRGSQVDMLRRRETLGFKVSYTAMVTQHCDTI